MSDLTRRRFLASASAVATSAAAVSMFPSVAGAASPISGRTPFTGVTHDSSTGYEFSQRIVRHADLPLRELAAKALESALAAGASYADVRFTTILREKTLIRNLSRSNYGHDVSFDVGVRSLVHGYWGYANHPAWDLDCVARLGRESAGAAKTVAEGKSRTAELVATPTVADGQWQTHVEIDPWIVPFGEKTDYIHALHDFIRRQRLDIDFVESAMDFMRDERTFASSEGSFCSQTLFRSNGTMALALNADPRTGRPGQRLSDAWAIAGAGWEHIRNANMRDRLPPLFEEAELSRNPTHVEIGRYDVVFDPTTVAKLVAATIGDASDLHRTMGYNANREGTTYINDPLESLGTLRVGSQGLTVTASRTLPGGAATVQWDDEGVAPTDTTIVRQGVLDDFQTTRETASWIAPWYQKMNRPLRSSGAASSATAAEVTGTWQSNFVVEPSASKKTFDDLISGVTKGYAIYDASVNMDHQCLNGWGQGVFVREISRGKLGRAVSGLGFVFRTPEFWKNFDTGADADSSRAVGVTTYKTDGTKISRTVLTPPVRIREVTTADFWRRS